MLLSRRASAAIALAVLLAACEIEKVGIPSTEAQVALHGVLSASAPSQVVLLERTRNGTLAILAPSFEVLDPVLSDEGIAESGAIVTMTTPTGRTLVAREDAVVRSDGEGRGVYRFDLPGDSLERGGTYELTVRTTRNEVLTAATSVPAGAAAFLAGQATFDRVRDTLMLAWPPAPGARSYLVRIETPFGPRSFFTDATRVRLSGELRNIDVAALPRVFIPGFPQVVTVSAVDSNYYDWFRTHSNTISGTGLINRVAGGIGVFGSLVRLRFEDYHVVAPQTEPEAGMFQFVGTPEQQLSTRILRLDLYVESRAARADQAHALSGRYHKRPVIGQSGCLTCGLLGTTRDGRVELALLVDWYARDTADLFVGQIRGDTIVGTLRAAGGLLRFVRQP
ncbi:MAG TPA: hypothetical protein VJ802_13230 [Gemmatimonadaceae bacterium]|nr:hypothetical protein [Gemmatimonadaceae bacterium]